MICCACWSVFLTMSQRGKLHAEQCALSDMLWHVLAEGRLYLAVELCLMASLWARGICECKNPPYWKQRDLICLLYKSADTAFWLCTAAYSPVRHGIYLTDQRRWQSWTICLLLLILLERQNMLTCKLGRYCILALYGSIDGLKHFFTLRYLFFCTSIQVLRHLKPGPAYILGCLLLTEIINLIWKLLFYPFDMIQELMHYHYYWRFEPANRITFGQ